MEIILLALSLVLVALIIQRSGRPERVPVRLYIPRQRVVRRRQR